MIQKKISQEEILERLYRDDYITDDEAELLFDNLDKRLEIRKEEYENKEKIFDREIVLTSVICATRK